MSQSARFSAESPLKKQFEYIDREAALFASHSKQQSNLRTPVSDSHLRNRSAKTISLHSQSSTIKPAPSVPAFESGRSNRRVGHQSSDYRTSVVDFSPQKPSRTRSSTSALSNEYMTFNTCISPSSLQTNYKDNQVDKTSISKLGLRLHPICLKPTHERNKISYICSEIECTQVSRFGCAHCFLENHADDHAQRNVRIEDFVASIESKETRYVEGVQNLRQLGKLLASPPFLKQMLNDLDRLKDEFNSGIERIKDNLTNHVGAELLIDNKIVEQEIDKAEKLLFTIRAAMQKNIFQMKESEIDIALKLHHDIIASDLLKRTFVLQQRQADLSEKYLSAFEVTLEEMAGQVKKILKGFNRIDLHLLVKSNDADEDIHEVNASSPIRMITEGTQRTLTQQSSGIDVEILTTKNSFPFNFYNESCAHSVRCNTIPIFDCCKQAYKCTICHDLQANHKHVVTNPSKRYCMRCLKVFLVKYPTNVAINCKQCRQLRQ